jgi:hypothetical protein
MFVLKLGSNQNKKYHKLKIAVFRDIVQCYFVEIYRRFRGVCSHHTAHRSLVDPARNANLAAMHGFARESNVRYYPT